MRRGKDVHKKDSVWGGNESIKEKRVVTVIRGRIRFDGSDSPTREGVPLPGTEMLPRWQEVKGSLLPSNTMTGSIHMR